MPSCLPLRGNTGSGQSLWWWWLACQSALTADGPTADDTCCITYTHYVKLTYTQYGASPFPACCPITSTYTPPPRAASILPAAYYQQQSTSGVNWEQSIAMQQLRTPLLVPEDGECGCYSPNSSRALGLSGLGPSVCMPCRPLSGSVEGLSSLGHQGVG